MKGPVLFVAAGALLLSGNAFALEKRTPGVISMPFRRASELDKRSGPVQAGLKNTPSLYLVDFTVGTPPQTISAQLDTGSSNLIMNSPKSNICTSNPTVCAAGAVYNANASSTYHYVDSTLNIMYQGKDGGTGDHATDVFSIGGAILTGFQFGITYISTLSECVFGVGYSDSFDNLPALLVKQGQIATRAYSLFLNDASATSGTLLLGGMDTSKYKGNLITIPFLPDNGQSTVTEFLVTANSVSASDAFGNPVALAGGSTPLVVLLDSGTTQTTLPSTLATSIFNFFGVTPSSDTTSLPPIDCSALTDPRTLSIAFPGLTITVSMRQIVRSNGDGTCGFGIGATEAGNPNILGVSFLTSMYVIFDLDNNQASIAQANYNSISSNILQITGPISPAVSSSSPPANSASSASITPASSATSTKATSSGQGLIPASSSTSNVKALLSSVTASVPTSSPTSPSSLFVYDGCYSTGLSGFVVIGTDPAMTVTLCLSLAKNSGYLYAGLNGNTCYGSQTFTPSAASKVPDSQCSLPCPGGSGFCGGSASSSTKRQATILLSVYQQVSVLSSPTGGAVTSNASTSVLVTVNAGVTVYLKIGQPYIQLVSAVYTGICGCAAGLGPLTTTSAVTLTYGCPNGCAPTTIPMTTATQLCSNCGPTGGPATVTVTIPCTACSTPTGPRPAGYTGPYVSANGAEALAPNKMVILALFMLLLYFTVY